MPISLDQLHQMVARMREDFREVALKDPGFHLLASPMVERFNFLLGKARETLKNKELLERITEVRLDERPLQYADFLIILGQLQAAIEVELFKPKGRGMVVP